MGLNSFYSLILFILLWYIGEALEEADICDGSVTSIDVESSVTVTVSKNLYFPLEQPSCSQTLTGISGKFLIQLRDFHLGKLDELTISSLDENTRTLEKVVTWTNDLPRRAFEPFYINASKVLLDWQSNSHQISNHSFQITFTVIFQDTEEDCLRKQFRALCDDGDCIKDVLMCDNVLHCRDGSDEKNCLLHVALQQLANTTTTVTVSSTPSFIEEDENPLDSAKNAYLWLPLVVVIVFTGIMITLIALGRRRSQETQIPSRTDTTNLENTYSDRERDPNAPATPPPSYSVLERQFSYTSHVSQRSSEVSEPPDYIEAVHLPKSNSTRRSRPPLTRQSTNRHMAPRPSFLRALGNRSDRFRLFSRSVSSQDGRMRRNASDTSGVSSDASFDARNSGLSDVFLEVSPDQPSTHSRSSLRNTSVAEVPESSPIPCIAPTGLPAEKAVANTGSMSPYQRSISLDTATSVPTELAETPLQSNISQVALLANQLSPATEEQPLTGNPSNV